MSVDVIDKVMRTLELSGFTTVRGSTSRALVEAIVGVVFEEFETRMKHYIDAVQLMGDMVNVHNEAIRGMTTPAPLEPRGVVWDCYCGTRNAGGRTCIVCDRRA